MNISLAQEQSTRVDRERLTRHQRVRRKLEGKIGKVSEEVWSYLVGEGYVDEVDSDEPRAWAELYQSASDERSRLRHGGQNGSTSGRIRPDLDAYLQRRSKVVSDYHAAEAAELPRVRRFRREVLAGLQRVWDPTSPDHAVFRKPTGQLATSAEVQQAERFTLGRDEALALLSSPAPRLLPRGWFDANRVPFCQHQSKVVKEWRRMGTKKGTTPAAQRGFASKGWWTHYVRLSIAAKSVRRSTTVSLPQCVLRPKWPAPSDLVFPTANGEVDRRPVWPGTAFDALRDLSEALASRSPWSVPQAVWFALTGETPWIWPVEAEYRISWQDDVSLARISLAVEPWVPADSLLRIYRDIQRRMLQGDNRLVDEEALRLFSWVARRRRDAARPTWKEMVVEWDGQHPPPDKSSHGGNYRRFYTYWRRAMDAIFPAYVPPDRFGPTDDTPTNGGSA